ncbi:MAG TPA: DNA methyltransferase, partial [Pyrinomonadaceae bacterium]|nr:DNA methyltransferase [Pyrinomonadaceae bacterium]
MTILPTIGKVTGSSTAISRWATFGPYYAMFPIEFVFEIVDRYSKPGDYILDPFAGRFSVVYAGAVLGRNATGIEINPVGWLYGKTKLSPAPKALVLERLKDVCDASEQHSIDNLPEFFHYCYSAPVLKFLAAAREILNWRRSKIDASLMSVILVNLHGKKGEGLSNQMRQTKAMSAAYSIRWWKANGYAEPPVYDAKNFITEKINWRYAKGIPETKGAAKVYLGDSTKRLNDVIRTTNESTQKYSLLFTSPPYQGVVDYHADQWLRLWLLKESRTFD